MSKKAIIWIVIGASIETIVVIFLIVFAINNSLQPTEKSIKKALNKYEHNSEMIYSDYGDIFYLNNLYEYENDILWIDDNHLIYQKDNKYYYADNDIQKELSFNNINYINHGSLFLENNKIYFKYNELYYEYNLSNDSLTGIEEDNYFNIKNGEKYKIETKVEYSKTTITIIDNNNVKKIITNDTLNKNKLLKNVNKVMKIRLFNYSIWNDEIYLHLYGGPYSIIVKYDFETGKIDYYDWFYREESRTCYLAFRISDKNNIPVLKDYLN